MIPRSTTIVTANTTRKKRTSISSCAFFHFECGLPFLWRYRFLFEEMLNGRANRYAGARFQSRGRDRDTETEEQYKTRIQRQREEQAAAARRRKEQEEAWKVRRQMERENG